MLAMDMFQEACRAQVLVVAECLDLAPEFARSLRNSGFSHQLFAALD
jgi:hypothetical protein